jgi:hypothetical protein
LEAVMTRFLYWAAGVLAVASLVSQAEAAPDALQAREVVREYLEAIRAEGFSAQARFLHPEELVRFQQILMPVYEANEAAGSRVLLNATFGREASLLDARLADPADFMRRFARVMAVRMPDQPVGFEELEVLGMVEEGPRMHVLVRLRTGSEEAAFESLEVVSLLPDGEAWRVMLSPELEAAARSMDTRGQGARPAPRLEPRALPPEPESTDEAAQQEGLAIP